MLCFLEEKKWKEKDTSRLVENKKTILSLKYVDKKWVIVSTHENIEVNVIFSWRSKIVPTILNEKHQEKKEKKNEKIRHDMQPTRVSQSVSQSFFPSKQNKTKHSLIIKNVVWVFHIIFYRNLRKKNCSLVKLYITKARNRKVLWCAKNWYYNRNVCKIIDWIKQFILRGADCHTLLDLINFV